MYLPYLKESDAVQWKEGDAHFTGVLIANPNGSTVTQNGYALTAESHTRRLKFVSAEMLMPYPAEPIPEPELRTYE